MLVLKLKESKLINELSNINMFGIRITYSLMYKRTKHKYTNGNYKLEMKSAFAYLVLAAQSH